MQDVQQAPVKSIRTNPANHAAEGDERRCEVMGCARAAAVKISVVRMDETSAWHGWGCEEHADGLGAGCDGLDIARVTSWKGMERRAKRDQPHGHEKGGAMNTEDARKHALNWLKAADNVSLIGYAPAVDDEICVTVIVSSYRKLPTPEDDPARWRNQSAAKPGGMG